MMGAAAKAKEARLSPGMAADLNKWPVNLEEEGATVPSDLP